VFTLVPVLCLPVAGWALYRVGRKLERSLVWQRIAALVWALACLPALLLPVVSLDGVRGIEIPEPLFLILIFDTLFIAPVALTFLAVSLALPLRKTSIADQASS